MIPFMTKAADGSVHTNTVFDAAHRLNGGIAVNPDKSVVISTLVPEFFVNGLGVLSTGALCVAPGGVIDSYSNGLPFTADGRLVVQNNQPDSPGDGWIGGVRIGPLGGVYVTDATPVVPFEFSSAYGGGFN